MIWIIGGTSEAGILADRLEALGQNYIMSVATEEGKEFFKTAKLHIGRMSKEEMAEFCRLKKITAVADLSHPYARAVSQNAKAAACELGITYVRFIRKPSALKNEGRHFKNIEVLKSFLLTLHSASVFFTTGSKNVQDFEAVRGSNRFVYRILPAPESLLKCKEAGVLTQDIIAITGPISEGLNKALFEFCKAEYVVMKNSGEEGGTKEKIAACKALNIQPLIIERETEGGFTSLDAVEKEILKL